MSEKRLVLLHLYTFILFMLVAFSAYHAVYAEADVMKLFYFLTFFFSAVLLLILAELAVILEDLYKKIKEVRKWVSTSKRRY